MTEARPSVARSMAGPLLIIAAFTLGLIAKITTPQYADADERSPFYLALIPFALSGAIACLFGLKGAPTALKLALIACTAIGLLLALSGFMVAFWPKC